MNFIWMILKIIFNLKSILKKLFIILKNYYNIFVKKNLIFIFLTYK